MLSAYSFVTFPHLISSASVVPPALVYPHTCVSRQPVLTQQADIITSILNHASGVKDKYGSYVTPIVLQLFYSFHLQTFVCFFYLLPICVVLSHINSFAEIIMRKMN